MNRKGQAYIILIVLLIAVAVFFFFRMTGPDEDSDRADISAEVIREIQNNIGFEGVRDPINTARSRLFFEGFGPGKSHEGKFDDWSGDLLIEDGKIVGFEGTIDVASVNTGIDGLDDHLKTDDFFGVDNFPKIKFMSTDLTAGKLTGDLTFLGVTKEVSFPVSIKEDSISADFVLDTTRFGDMDDRANKDVRIFFELFK